MPGRRVYVLSYVDWEIHMARGVYSSLEKAEKAREGDKTFKVHELDIEEVVLDAEPTMVETVR